MQYHVKESWTTKELITFDAGPATKSPAKNEMTRAIATALGARFLSLPLSDGSDMRTSFKLNDEAYVGSISTIPTGYFNVRRNL